MAELVKWSGGGGLSFFIKNNEIRGVKDLNISASTETEDTTNGGEKYIKKKNSGSYQISMTAVLNAALGVDVQSLAVAMAECARTGATGYFYTAGAKLFPSNFMCVDAKIGNIQMTPAGKWSYCEVTWTLKQCSKYDGTTGSSSSSSGGSGGSTKKTTTTSTSSSILTKVKTAVTNVVTNVKNAVTGVINTISAAKAASEKAKANLTTKKTTTTTVKATGGGGVKKVHMVK